MKFIVFWVSIAEILLLWLKEGQGFNFSGNVVVHLHKTTHRFMGTILLPISILTSTWCQGTAASADCRVWNLPNGEVELCDQVQHFSWLQLTNPILLGSGGGGAVFSTRSQNIDEIHKDVALKISWARSTASVERECRILKELERQNVRNVELCLGEERYSKDSKRVVIALEPVVEYSVARVDKINEDVQELAVQSIVRTLLDMLRANVATTDVQPLMNAKSGSVVFIDMTEAEIMSDPPSFLDLALASSFCNEMVSIIPESLASVASATFVEELNTMHSHRGRFFALEIYEILQNQSVLVDSGEAQKLIESTIAMLK